MAWVYLIVGGLFEALFSFSLGKISMTEGKVMVTWLIVFVLSVSLSMYLLYKAISAGLEIGTSYAVWAAIGTFGSVLMGILFFKEPITFWRLFFLTTLIISVVGLKLTSVE